MISNYKSLTKIETYGEYNVRKNILVVDDTTENLAVLNGLLREKYEVRCVKSAKVAFLAIEKRKPDIILLDIMMPEMDGFEMFEVLKSKPDYADIPVIFVTATEDEETKEKARKLGALGFITKPIDPAMVHEQIEKHS
jgi:putative two-component system response regulator